MLMMKQTEFEKTSTFKKNTGQIKETKVHFNSDYDITDVLKRWGAWSRKDYYENQGTPSYYDAQPKKLKELCSDDDGLLIDECLTTMLKLSRSSKKQLEVLKYFYFGEKLTIEQCAYDTGFARFLGNLFSNGLASITDIKDFKIEKKFIIKPITVVDIAKKLDMKASEVTKLKEAGENYLVGHLSAITLMTGQKLEILEKMRYM